MDEDKSYYPPTNKSMNDPRYEGEGRPNYMMPKVEYPSYNDLSNEEPNEPVYVANDRGYSEYR